MVAVLVPGHNNDLGLRPDLPQSSYGGEAFGRTVGIGRQSEVYDRERGPLAFEHFDGFASSTRGKDLVLRQQPTILRSHALIIIKHQNGCALFAHAGATFFARAPGGDAAAGVALGTTIRMIVPWPATLMTSRSPPAARKVSRAWNAPMPWPRDL